MKTTKITSTEAEPLLIASLPTRPTAPGAFGGRGYTATEMKAAFDKLPLLIIERFNDLIGDIEDGEVCGSIPTGIDGAPTLAKLFAAFGEGALASVITYRDTTLTAYLEALRKDVDRLLAAKEGVTDK
jgi:hypothetical protein